MASFNVSKATTSEINELAEYYAELYCEYYETIQPHVIARNLGIKYSTNVSVR